MGRMLVYLQAVDTGRDPPPGAAVFSPIPRDWFCRWPVSVIDASPGLCPRRPKRAGQRVRAGGHGRPAAQLVVAAGCAGPVTGTAGQRHPGLAVLDVVDGHLARLDTPRRGP